MADILQDFPIRATPARVFEAISHPSGLDAWWTARSSGVPAEGNIYELDFGPGYLWRAAVSRCAAISRKGSSSRTSAAWMRDTRPRRERR